MTKRQAELLQVHAEYLSGSKLVGKEMLKLHPTASKTTVPLEFGGYAPYAPVSVSVHHLPNNTVLSVYHHFETAS